jgi:hypothetical protein
MQLSKKGNLAKMRQISSAMIRKGAWRKRACRAFAEQSRGLQQG